MPFSHHSHSGQFCAHAKNTLSEMVSTAANKGMSIFGMTEHIPRGNDELYPEELQAGYNAVKLAEQFEQYVMEAERLRKKYKDRANELEIENPMKLLIAFEAEWIRPERSTAIVHDLLAKYSFDYFIGSVHHVRTVPIDYNRELYDEVRDKCGGTEEKLFSEYFDAQYEMLQALKPKIVGHFDLVRLWSDEPDRSWTSYNSGEIWSRIIRNLQYIVDQGFLLEINTAAWRKNLQEPYPRSEICTAFIEMGGSFVLSDDSHAIEHVATNYFKLPDFLRRIGLSRISYLEHDEDGRLTTKSIDGEAFTQHSFWRKERSMSH